MLGLALLASAVLAVALPDRCGGAEPPDGPQNAEVGSGRLGAAARENMQSQIRALYELKAGRTESEKKLSTELWLMERTLRGGAAKRALPRLAAVKAAEGMETGTLVDCNILCDATDRLAALIEGEGGRIVSRSVRFGAIHAKVPIGRLEAIARHPDVRRIRRTERPTLNKANTSEGDAAHRAASARSVYGVTGKGVKVGVISDSVRNLALVQEIGDLPSVAVPAGCDGMLEDGSDTGEGTAMLEIVHDLAPGAELCFADHASTEEECAERILLLAAMGCKVIVDDVTFLREPAYQDGAISEAIRDFTERGGVYFSSAGNFGNLDSKQSGTWEGDFRGLGEVLDGESKSYEPHDFGTAPDPDVDTLVPLEAKFQIQLQWSDPWGASGNDYDLLCVSMDTGELLGASCDDQDGDGDPFEQLGYVWNEETANPGLAILRTTGAEVRHVRLQAKGGIFAAGTCGSTVGHNADEAAICLAAVPTVTNRAFAASHPAENFSSDGPRRMYFDRAGHVLGNGSLLADGGVDRQKPDFAAADQVSCRTPGFDPFGGTSAAAPHAAAIAALMLEMNPGLDRDGIFAIMKQATFSRAAAAWNRTKGYGILDAEECVRLAMESNPRAIPPIPAAPAPGLSKNTLSWNAVPGAKYYRVYRETHPNRNPAAYGGWQTETSKTIERPEYSSGDVYFYYVKAASTTNEATAGSFSKYCAAGYTNTITPQIFTPSSLPFTLYSGKSFSGSSFATIVKNPKSDSGQGLDMTFQYEDTSGFGFGRTTSLNSGNLTTMSGNYTVALSARLSYMISGGVAFYGFQPSQEKDVKAGSWLTLPHYVYVGSGISVQTTATQTVAAAGGTCSEPVVRTPASGEWSADADAGWIHLYRTGGQGSGELGFLVDPNEGGARTGTISLMTPGAVDAFKRIVVEQAAGSGIPHVVSLSIGGPDEVASGADAVYACTARWSDGTATDVSQEAGWEMCAGAAYADIAAGGRFTARSTKEDRHAGIRAVYAGMAATTAVRILSGAGVRPANDDFASAGPLGDEPEGCATGDNTDATRETGEPAIYGIECPNSVWWTWTAPATGVACFDSAGSGFIPVMEAFVKGSGTGFGALVSVGSAYGRMWFETRAGQTYWIAVAGADEIASGNISLSWRQCVRVAFDGNGATFGTMGVRTNAYATATALPPCGFSRTGWTFDGWATNAAGPVVWPDGAAAAFRADTTLHACWSEGQGNGAPRVSGSVIDMDEGVCRLALRGAKGVTYRMQRARTLDGTWSFVGARVTAPEDGMLELEGTVSGTWPTGFFRLVADGAGGVAEPAATNPPPAGPYLVVDMGGGASASAWPVSSLDAPPADGWTQAHKTTNLVLRWIPSGEGTMGSPPDELGRTDDETFHALRLTTGFYIGVFEVTQKQWELAMGDNPSLFSGEARPVEMVSYDMIRGDGAGGEWPDSGRVDGGSFLAVLREKTGLDFELPTEAQWEYACRAGTGTALNSGKDLSGERACPNLSALARYDADSGNGTWDGRGGFKQHTTAGSYAPNAWGLYDMHGNVLEWCLDWHGPLGADTATDPAGPASGLDRVCRGGGWSGYAAGCRSASRSCEEPQEVRAYLGLRLALPESAFRERQASKKDDAAGAGTEILRP